VDALTPLTFTEDPHDIRADGGAHAGHRHRPAPHGSVK
jgi:hypothetical protein